MGTITYAQMCDALASTLGAATGLARTQSYNELTEDYPDLPLLQVYPSGNEVDALSTTADRRTFRAGSRLNQVRLVADVICRTRSHLAEDVAKQLEMWEAIEAVLYTQNTKPYFGDAGIKGFHWASEMVYLGRGDTQIGYAAVRFTITLQVF